MPKKPKIEATIVKKVFQHHHLGEINSIKELQGGYANPAFLVNNRYVIRFNADKNADRKDCFLREFTLYSLLSRHTIPAPETIVVNTKLDIIPYYYIKS